MYVLVAIISRNAGDDIPTSAKCKLVRKPHANLRDTSVFINSALKYIQMLQGPPGALQCAFRLCKSIIRCSWKHLLLWWCIQDATRLTIKIVQLWRFWDFCADLQETWRVAETSAQVCGRLPEPLRSLHKLCGRLGVIFSTQWFLEFHNDKAYCLSYLSLSQTNDLLRHDMTCII
jgi:hypothetical protein